MQQKSKTITQLVAIYRRITKYACISVFTDIWPTYACMYSIYLRRAFIGVFALDAHKNAHEVEANQKHIESILITLVFKFIDTA